MGVAFKPGTDDVRESPYLQLVAVLQELGFGCSVRMHDGNLVDTHFANRNTTFWPNIIYVGCEVYEKTFGILSGVSIVCAGGWTGSAT